MEEYYVYRTKIPGWKGHSIWAEPYNRAYANDLQNLVLRETPLDSHFPELLCWVNGKLPAPPDVLYVSGGGIELYSARLLHLLTAAHVRYETIAVGLFDKETGERLDWNYGAFHLLEHMAGIDEEKSDIDWDFWHIHRLELTDECLRSKAPMVRMKKFGYITLMKKWLMEKLIEAQITGFKFVAASNYSHC